MEQGGSNSKRGGEGWEEEEEDGKGEGWERYGRIG